MRFKALVPLSILLISAAGCGDITEEPTTRSCASDDAISGSGGEEHRAALFAIRAGGSAGFLDEGPTFRDWESVEADGDNFVGHFKPDLDMEVALDGDTWRVVSIDGAVDDETCFTLLGYEEPDSAVPVEHEFLNIRLRAENKRAAVGAALIGSPVWMGPIPYEGHISRCYAELYDEEGAPTHRTRYYDVEIPSLETNRTSGNTFISVPADDDAASGRFVCQTVPD